MIKHQIQILISYLLVKSWYQFCSLYYFLKNGHYYLHIQVICKSLVSS